MKSVLLLVCAQALNIKEQYLGFLATYGRAWSDSGFEAFQENVRQSQNSTTHGVGPFFDLTKEEFRAQYLSSVHIVSGTNTQATGPSSLDWRTEGVIPPVWDQGQSETPVHYVAADNLASVTAILRKEKVVNPSSLRSMLEKCTGCTSLGCNFNFSAAEGLCSTYSGDCKCTPDFTYSGYKSIADEANLLAAVALGPVSAYVDAESWETYGGGILDKCHAGTLDHAVLVVGYGTQAGQDYWIIKNSWGVAWGENGYIRLIRGKSGQGACSIAMMDYLPIASR